MRIKSRITFHMKPIDAEKILSPLNQKVSIKDTLQIVTLYKDTEQYRGLIDMLNKLDSDYSELEERIYSVAEYTTAELFYVIPNVYCGYPKPDNDGSYIDMSYNDKTGCEKCKRGILQNRPLRILKPKMGANDISALHWIYEFVITSKLKSVIEQEKLTGFEIWPVINHTQNIQFDDIYQLYIISRMPPMSSKTNFLLDSKSNCICGRNGRIIKEQKKYERSVLTGLKDFNRTCEWLGGGFSTTQVPIFSKKAYDVFMKNKIKGVRFEPIEIIS